MVHNEEIVTMVGVGGGGACWDGSTVGRMNWFGYLSALLSLPALCTRSPWRSLWKRTACGLAFHTQSQHTSLYQDYKEESEFIIDPSRRLRVVRRLPVELTTYIRFILVLAWNQWTNDQHHHRLSPAIIKASWCFSSVLLHFILSSCVPLILARCCLWRG